MEAAIAFLEAVKGTCEACGNARRYVTAVLGYERLCYKCQTFIINHYTYVEFMTATNGTGNARMLTLVPAGVEVD
jgi:hypothetical protein